MSVTSLSHRARECQIGAKLRIVGHTHGCPDGGMGHFCPGCRVMHVFSVAEWDGNRERPTFSAEKNLAWGSMRDPKWRWGGGRCHYTLCGGIIYFFADCTHKLAGRSVPLPALPGHLKD